MFEGQEEQGQGSLMDRHEGPAGRLDAEHGDGIDSQHMSLADTAEKGVCLPARMAAAHRACVSTQGTPQEGSGCARNAACMVPVLLEGDQMIKVVNFTHLLYQVRMKAMDGARGSFALSRRT